MIGIDRGIVNTISLSSGERFSLPARLETLSRQRRQVQRAMSRRKRGSRRYVSARRRAVNIASRIGRVRKDWQHRSTTGLAKRFGVIVLEDLNTKGMTASARGTIEKPGKNVRQKAGLDRSILNQGWYIFETLLTYKLEERGGRLIKVDPAYTSQTCFECGTVDKESRESQASFHCRHCGHRDHADINAAKNILRRSTAFMDVEEGHWFSCEASTGGSVAPVNPTAHVVGGC